MYLRELKVDMATATDYDGSLTSRIRAELDEMGAPSSDERTWIGRMIERLESELRGPVSEPVRREKTLAFLRGPVAAGLPLATAPPPPNVGPLRGALNEIAVLSARLDQSTDPGEGFSLAESVAQQVHELAYIVEGFLSTLDPKDGITKGFGRLGALLSQLIRNAVAKMRAFAKLLHVTSFSVTFYTTPPQLSVTFNFDTT